MKIQQRIERTVRHEKHLHVKYACIVYGFNGPSGYILSVRSKLSEYNVTDIIFTNCLYDRMRASWLPSEPPPSRSGYRRMGGMPIK